MTRTATNVEHDTVEILHRRTATWSRFVAGTPTKAEWFWAILQDTGSADVEWAIWKTPGPHGQYRTSACFGREPDDLVPWDRPAPRAGCPWEPPIGRGLATEPVDRPGTARY